MLYDSCRYCHQWSSIVNSGLTSCQCFPSYWGPVSGLCFFPGLRSAWGTKIGPEVFELFPSEWERRVGRVLVFSHMCRTQDKNTKLNDRLKKWLTTDTSLVARSSHQNSACVLTKIARIHLFSLTTFKHSFKYHAYLCQW